MAQKSLLSIITNKDFVLGAGCGVLFFYVLGNIIISQTISPVYFKLINNDKAAAVEFLQKIRKDPRFTEQLTGYKETFGSRLEEDIFLEDRIRDENIKKLEQINIESPNLRDILYGLYILYYEKKDYEKASGYLQDARALDPSLTDISALSVSF